MDVKPHPNQFLMYVNHIKLIILSDITLMNPDCRPGVCNEYVLQGAFI